MKLYYDKRLSEPTYYVQQGIRNGKKVTSKNVKIIGKHSELLKITSDPLSYAKEDIRKMNEQYRTGRVSYTISAGFNERVKKTDLEASSSTCLNIGYFFLQETMAGLHLNDFFRQITEQRRMAFDCHAIFRFLTYSRVLDPCSKLAAVKSLVHYYETPFFSHQDVLRFMDLLADHYHDYLKWLFHNSCNVVKRDTSVLYYDCTNFYCECEHQDEDVVDEVTGELYDIV